MDNYSAMWHPVSKLEFLNFLKDSSNSATCFIAMSTYLLSCCNHLLTYIVTCFEVTWSTWDSLAYTCTWNWPNKSQILECLLFPWTWACWCSCPEAPCTAHTHAPVLSSYCTSLRKVRPRFSSTNSEFQDSIRRTVSQAPCPPWMTGPIGMHKSHAQEGGLAPTFTGIVHFSLS
jgi:hypothetical protein